MTNSEAAAFNAGVEAVLSIAKRTAGAIASTSRRHVHEDFAVAALGELAEAGRALLLPVEPVSQKETIAATLSPKQDAA